MQMLLKSADRDWEYVIKSSVITPQRNGSRVEMISFHTRWCDLVKGIWSEERQDIRTVIMFILFKTTSPKMCHEWTIVEPFFTHLLSFGLKNELTRRTFVKCINTFLWYTYLKYVSGHSDSFTIIQENIPSKDEENKLTIAHWWIGSWYYGYSKPYFAKDFHHFSIRLMFQSEEKSM